MNGQTHDRVHADVAEGLVVEMDEDLSGDAIVDELLVIAAKAERGKQIAHVVLLPLEDVGARQTAQGRGAHGRGQTEMSRQIERESRGIEREERRCCDVAWSLLLFHCPTAYSPSLPRYSLERA
jgi:predicted secreted Zn-dependent protease